MTAGAGTTGTSMVQIFVAYGYGTVLCNHRETTLQKARRMVEPNQEALVLSEELSQAESDAVKACIQLIPDESCFQDCDIAMKSIVKNM